MLLNYSSHFADFKYLIEAGWNEKLKLCSNIFSYFLNLKRVKPDYTLTDVIVLLITLLNDIKNDFYLLIGNKRKLYMAFKLEIIYLDLNLHTLQKLLFFA